MCRIGNNRPGIPAVAAWGVVDGNITINGGIFICGVAVVCCQWCIVDAADGESDCGR